MAGIPFLSRIKALAGILVRTDFGVDKKEVILNNSPDQALNSTITVDLPSIAGAIPVKSEVILTSDRGSLTSPNAVASLVSGKVPLDQLPNISITNVYTVTDQAARLALDAQVGDVAIQTDTNTTYILTALPASTNANWTVISATNAITEVNGVAGPGAITLTPADIGAVDVTGDTMSGVLTMGPNGPVGGPYTVGEIAFRTDSDTNLYSVSLKAPVNASLSDYVSLTLPSSHGSAGQVLSTSGSTGILSWIDNTAANAVLSVNGESGPNVVLDAADVGAVAVNGSNYMTNLLRIHRHDTLSGATGGIQLGDLSSATAPNYVTLRAPDAVTSYTVTLPSVAPTAGQTLLAGLSGATSWAIVPGTLDHPTTGSTFEYSKNNAGMTGEYNTAIGVEAGGSITTGTGNVLLGWRAGTSLTLGATSVAIGAEALKNDTNGQGNVAVGHQALFSNGGGVRNAAFGYGAGINYDVGSSCNTAINSDGPSSLAALSGTVAIGRDASSVYATVSANNQFALGTASHRYYMPGKFEGDLSIGALSGVTKSLKFFNGAEDRFVAFKADAATSVSTTYTLPLTDGAAGQSLLTSGGGVLSWGAATGSLSHPTSESTFELGKNNPSMTGGGNTAIGVAAGQSIIGGQGNALFGAYVGHNLTTGDNNVAMGYGVLSSATTAQNNVSLGNSSLTSITSGQRNVAIGYLAAGALLGASKNNTFINSQGASSGLTIDGAVAIGLDSDGSYATVSASNQFVLGTSKHRYYVPGKVESDLSIGALSGSSKSLKFFNGDETHFVALKADSTISATTTYTLPLSIGSAGQVMQTSATGALSWATVVKSVNSVSPADGNGAITLYTDNIQEDGSPTNLWFTDDRAQTAIYGTSGNLTADRALVSSSGGKVAVSSTTATQIGYLSTVTSNVQDQIDSKVSKSGDTMTGILTMDKYGALAGQTGTIKLGDQSPTAKYVSLTVPSALTNSYSIILPTDVGAEHYVLASAGGGATVWEIPQDSVARAAINKLEQSRGVYAGSLGTGAQIDISDLVVGGGSEYPIVQIYKNVSGTWTNVNIEFSFDSSTQTITFGEIADGPIDAVVHVLALVSPYQTLTAV